MAASVEGPTTASRAPAIIAAQPNSTWETAQPFEFGRTIYGSADERPYAPAPGEDVYAAMLKGFQWFRFTFQGAQPRLAYFVLNVTDRDVPLDVDIFQLGGTTARQMLFLTVRENSSIRLRPPRTIPDSTSFVNAWRQTDSSRAWCTSTKACLL